MKAFMECPNCNGELQPEDQFCGNCGTTAPQPAGAPSISCPICGSLQEKDSLYCGSCGNDLGETPPPATTAPMPSNTCAACGAVQELDAAFCGSCGSTLRPEAVPLLPPVKTSPVAAANPVIATPSPAATSSPAEPRRQPSPWLGALFLILIIGAASAYMIIRNRSTEPPAAAPISAPPALSEEHSVSRSETDNAISIDTASIAPNVFDETGRFGFQVHVKVRGKDLQTARVVVHFFDSAGAPLKGIDPNFTDANGQLASSSPAGAGDSAVFVPYAGLGLQPGQHTIRVTPSLFHLNGQQLSRGSDLTFNHIEHGSFITKVQVQPDSTDQSGSRGILIVTSFISEALRGPRGMVGVHLKNLDTGQPLPGRNPAFTDGTGNLVVSREFSGAGERSLYSDISLFLPLDQISPDIRGLRAEISLFDPAQTRFLTPPTPFNIQLPAR
jgi:hypothetical protein